MLSKKKQKTQSFWASKVFFVLVLGKKLLKLRKIFLIMNEVGQLSKSREFLAMNYSMFNVHRSIIYSPILEMSTRLIIFFPTSLSTRFPPARPFSPLISAPTGSLGWGLVTKWAQLLITYPAQCEIEVR